MQFGVIIFLIISIEKPKFDQVLNARSLSTVVFLEVFGAGIAQSGTRFML